MNELNQEETKALSIIEVALMNYVNDSSGEGSDETKEIEKSFNLIKSKLYNE